MRDEQNRLLKINIIIITLLWYDPSNSVNENDTILSKAQDVQSKPMENDRKTHSTYNKSNTVYMFILLPLLLRLILYGGDHKDRTKQNKTKQNKTKQNKTKQNNTKQHKVTRSNTKYNTN